MGLGRHVWLGLYGCGLDGVGVGYGMVSSGLCIVVDTVGQYSRGAKVEVRHLATPSRLALMRMLLSYRFTRWNASVHCIVL